MSLNREGSGPVLRVRIATQLVIDVVRPEPPDGHSDKVLWRGNPGEVVLRVTLGPLRRRRVPRRPQEFADVVDVAPVSAVPPLAAVPVVGHQEALANVAVDVGVREEEHDAEEEESFALEICSCNVYEIFLIVELQERIFLIL